MLTTKEPMIVDIIDISSKGDGIAHFEGQTIFVPQGLVGERLSVQKTFRKKGVQYAKIIDIIVSQRRTPPCSVFGVCGGCPLQHMHYDAQLQAKQQRVEHIVHRLHRPEIQLHPILPAKSEYNYRNKLEFSFGMESMTVEWIDGKKIHHDRFPSCGFHKKGSFKEIAPVDLCHIAPQNMQIVFTAVSEILLSSRYTVYNPQIHTGQLRQLMIRENIHGETMVVIVVTEHLEAAVIEAIQQVSGVTSLYQVINTKRNDDWSDCPVEHVSGKEVFAETVSGLECIISPTSFFQTNTATFEAAIELFSEYLPSTPPKKIYDMYCGVGSLGLLLSQKYGRVPVHGVELIPAAIEMAKRNAQKAGIPSSYTSATVEQSGLDTLRLESDDLLIIDPPRSGLHPSVTQWIREYGPKHVFYMSCGPATWERDVGLLDTYSVSHVLPADFYPHTAHIELLTLLTREA